MSTQPRHYPRLNGTAVAPRPHNVETVLLSRRGWSISVAFRLALPVRMFLTRGRLDRQTAAACPCGSTAALELRARQLINPRARRRIARDLRRVIDRANRIGSHPTLSAAVIDPVAVTDGRRPILRLAQRLEARTPVSPEGVLLARALLTDGCSPLFNRACERTVAQAVGQVEHALEGKFPESGSVPHVEPLR